MRVTKIVVSLCLIVTTVSACSKENWIRVDDDFYVDGSSAKRNGDIGAATIKHGVHSGWYEFDCQSRKILKLPEIQVEEDSAIGKASAIACSRWFEFWKR